MIRFKFRAWDTKLNKMSKPFTFGHVLNFTDVNGLGSMKSLGDEHIILQDTSLVDKNGFDIYEGDLFQVANNHIYEVRYISQGHSNHEEYGACFCLFKSEDVFFPFDEFAIKNGVVLGNIFETPELL